MVIGNKRPAAVRIRANYCQLLHIPVKGQDIVIFQKNHGFFCCLYGQSAVFSASHCLIGNIVICAFSVKQPKPEPGTHGMYRSLCDILF